ncbi:hypothetical protein CEV31_0543 [Brucella thiophenivorans]|uniref:Uncharacterized protein n=1 Tax=Brucella thiophenivorans TaxID=571255 RepID=A0A256G3M9_9HYPH|nr:hypothetical protein CEV31_0543 [Brucella thiophenivorans]
MRANYMKEIAKNIAAFHMPSVVEVKHLFLGRQIQRQTCYVA